MFGNNLKRIREEKGFGVNELSRIAGVNASYISALERDEKKNPSTKILKKLADALGVSLEDLMKSDSIFIRTDYKEVEAHQTSLLDYDYPSNDASISKIKESQTQYTTDDVFDDPQEAMKFLLSQPSVMGFGGFDVNKLSEKELVDFANEVLHMINLISYKYRK